MQSYISPPPNCYNSPPYLHLFQSGFLSLLSLPPQKKTLLKTLTFPRPLFKKQLAHRHQCPQH